MLYQTPDLITALILGIAVGVTMGAVVAIVLVADPLRRDREELRRRMIAWQMRTYAADARLAAHKMLHRAEARELDRFSRKVPDLTVVK